MFDFTGGGSFGDLGGGYGIWIDTGSGSGSGSGTFNPYGGGSVIYNPNAANNQWLMIGAIVLIAVLLLRK